jgi:tripartite ATP-independent transporter DctM subunit
MTLIILFMVYLCGSMMLGLPIAFSLLFGSVATALHMGGTATNPQIVATQLMRGVDSVSMMALPFFIIAGELMNRGGLTKRIIYFCTIFVGGVRGGLGYVTILACLIFASLVGSAVASTAALGAILIPMMANAGYNRAKAAGLVAAGNMVAPIMPPSVPMIVYGVAAGVSIKSLFLGGIAPALYLTAVMSIVWFFISRKDAPPAIPLNLTAKEKLKIFMSGLWALLLPVIIIVGLRGGVFTATEAGVVAVVYAIFVGVFVYRELTRKDMFRALTSAAKTSAVVMFLAAAAQVAAYIMTIARMPQLITSALDGLVDRPLLMNVMLMAVVLVVGMAMDVVPTILILTPIFLPLLKAGGIDPVYFGIIFTLVNVLGLLTPPVGPVLNVACAAGKIRMEDILRPTMPYFIAQCILLFMMTLIPEMVLWPLEWIGGYVPRVHTPSLLDFF